MGLAVTALTSWWISHDVGMMQSLFNLHEVVKDGKTTSELTASMWWWIAAGLQLLIVLVLATFGLLSQMSVGVGIAVFSFYAWLSGVTLAPVLYAYTDVSIVKVFFISSSVFLGSAIFGHTTKINLRPFGTFFLMALIGLLIALLVNMFMASPVMDYVISMFAVVLFAGLTAFDMQKLEEMYKSGGNTYSAGLVVYGALTLYLDFINLFIHLLRLFGAKKD